ncbi:ABC transporter ATP-binding protein YheS [Apiospora phragmitis]|uniref:ABC transporter ATP-binding protein YheS n=1 Tax=Apiospora phragmitis TaxID=2905665 RepID=A0ABR1T806_9PEZI
MTSMESEFVASILCTSKQTRFNIATPNYRELDIEGLSIVVTFGTRTTAKGKENRRRAKALLKAIAEKLIPGIPEETRIAILQQTEVSDAKADGILPSTSSSQLNRGDRLVIEEVIEIATARSEVQTEIEILSSAIGSADPCGSLRGLRQLQYRRLQRELFLKDKDARLRSGTRGLQARKALISKGKEVAAMQLQRDQPNDEISPDILAKETNEAADLLAELELQVEPTKIAETESRAKRILSGLGFSEEIISPPWRGDDPPTLIIVSHDRDFISLCTDILIIKDKDLTYFHGDLPVYEASRAEKRLYMTKMKEAKEKQKDHMEKTIARNMKEGHAKDDQNKIRQAKSRQKKLDDRWGLEVNSQGGRFKLNRDLVGYHLTGRAEIEVEEEDRPVSLVLPDTTDLRFPGPLLSLEQVSFRYTSASSKKAKTAAAPSSFALGGVTLSVHMGDRIGIVGLNGSGKSTLIKLLLEETKPTSGTLTTHPRLKLGYYSQHAVDDLRRLREGDASLLLLLLLSRRGAANLTLATSQGSRRRARRGRRARPPRLAGPAGPPRVGRAAVQALGRAARAAAARAPPLGAAPLPRARRGHDAPRLRDGGCAAGRAARLGGRRGARQPRPVVHARRGGRAR